MLLFNGEEPCDPPLSGDKTCRVFQWIGQSFENCDRCGRPYWEEHLYEPTYGGSKGQFRVKVYIRTSKDKEIWYWEWVNVITNEEREACRKKWDGANAYYARMRSS